MVERQVVWLSAEATEFAALCEVCLADCRRELGLVVASRVSRVNGHLRSEADVGFMTCRRGHRILLRRATSARLALTHR